MKNYIDNWILHTIRTLMTFDMIRRSTKYFLWVHENLKRKLIAQVYFQYANVFFTPKIMYMQHQLHWMLAKVLTLCCSLTLFTTFVASFLCGTSSLVSTPTTSRQQITFLLSAKIYQTNGNHILIHPSIRILAKWPNIRLTYHLLLLTSPACVVRQICRCYELVIIYILRRVYEVFQSQLL